MRTYRFVRFLGDRVEAASQRVASMAEESRGPEAPLATDDDPHRAVRRTLPRVVAETLDGAAKHQVRIRAMTSGTGEDEPGAGLGIVFQVSVPDFEQVSALVARTVDATALDDPEYSLAEMNESESLDRLLALTADAFVFVVGDERVHVVPAQSVASLTDPQKRRTPHRDLYSRQLGRTFEEFAEGFVGDTTIAPDLTAAATRSETEQRLGTWASENGLGHVLAIRVSASAEETEATLGDFV
ncbi:MAG: hypothetical protein ACOCSF_05455 [Halanaeroarchaeum sp.]